MQEKQRDCIIFLPFPNLNTLKSNTSHSLMKKRACKLLISGVPSASPTPFVLSTFFNNFRNVIWKDKGFTFVETHSWLLSANSRACNQPRKKNITFVIIMVGSGELKKLDFAFCCELGYLKTQKTRNHRVRVHNGI